MLLRRQVYRTGGGGGGNQFRQGGNFSYVNLGVDVRKVATLQSRLHRVATRILSNVIPIPANRTGISPFVQASRDFLLEQTYVFSYHKSLSLGYYIHYIGIFKSCFVKMNCNYSSSRDSLYSPGNL